MTSDTAIEPGTSQIAVVAYPARMLDAFAVEQDKNDRHQKRVLFGWTIKTHKDVRLAKGTHVSKLHMFNDVNSRRRAKQEANAAVDQEREIKIVLEWVAGLTHDSRLDCVWRKDEMYVACAQRGEY